MRTAHKIVTGVFGGRSSYAFVNAEASALAARFTTPPTDARKLLIDNLFTSLKSVGLAKFDAFYVMAAADAQAAQRNWVQDLYNLTPTNSPTFTADRGYAGNGSTSYLATGFNPFTASSPKFIRDSAHVSVSDRTARAAADLIQIGGWVTGTSFVAEIGTRAVGNVTLGRVNQSATAGSPANSNSDGRFVASRTGASALSVYRNATALGAPNNASVAVASAEFYIGAVNQSGVAALFSSDQLSQASIGSGLTAGEIATVDAALATYFTAVGA